MQARSGLRTARIAGHEPESASPPNWPGKPAYLIFLPCRERRLLIVRRLFFIQRGTERWPSGRRRSPAKGVDLKRVSWVRIPSSPPVSISHASSLRSRLRTGGLTGRRAVARLAPSSNFVRNSPPPGARRRRAISRSCKAAQGDWCSLLLSPFSSVCPRRAGD